MESFDRNGFYIDREAVSRALIKRARRRILLEVRRHGLSADEIREWNDQTFFPWLRGAAEISALAPWDTARRLVGVQRGDFWAEPQILLKFPDEEQHWPLEPHTDILPPWAESRGVVYKGIFGVVLTEQGPIDGSPVFWVGSHRGARTSMTNVVGTQLSPGDVVAFHPNTGHSGSLNLGCTVRMSVYFRLMTAA